MGRARSPWALFRGRESSKTTAGIFRAGALDETPRINRKTRPVSGAGFNSPGLRFAHFDLDFWPEPGLHQLSRIARAQPQRQVIKPKKVRCLNILTFEEQSALSRLSQAQNKVYTFAV